MILSRSDRRNLCDFWQKQIVVSDIWGAGVTLYYRQGKKRIKERREKEHQVSQIIIKRWQDAQTKKKIADEIREASIHHALF